MAADDRSTVPRRTQAACALVAAALVLGLGAAVADAASPSGETNPRFAGRALTEALRDLGRQGLRIVFTSAVVRAGMTVESEPAATEPREILDEILAPHGLRIREGPGGTLIVVPGELGDPLAPDQERSGVPLAASPVFRDEVVVTPSRASLLEGEGTGVVTLSRDDILALPHLGDDLFRALSLLPGTASNDVSAAFHVRGGRRDETQVLLDGQELFDVYHLKDYDQALSVVSPATLGSAELMTGGYAASYGDRMSGVLDLRTLPPTGTTRFRVGAAVLGAHAGGRGSLPGERGGWMAEIRRGSTDLVGRLLGSENPKYWDGFGKLDLRLGATSTLSANFLYAEDELEFREIVDGDVKRFGTSYVSSHGWLDLLSVLRADLVVDTAASHARIDRDRRGAEIEEGVDYTILDLRDADVDEIRQSWHHAASPVHSLEWGGSWRRFASEFDYFGIRDLDDPLAAIRADGGSGTTAFSGRFTEDHPSLYLTDAMRLHPRATLELGLRWDRTTQTDEAHVSPRLNAAWRPDERSVARLAWGLYDQSQRPYELQVEDGETRLQPVEHSEHRILGYERLLGTARNELALRVELYQYLVDDPRPRYENIFEPLNTFPEVEPARVRVVPERSRSRGIEVFLRGDPRRRLRWWVGSAWASTQDEIDGRWTPRLFDQTHALTVDLDYDLTETWRVAAAWRFHTGWPTTPLSLETREVDGGGTEFVPVLGPLNSERLAAYHRLDLRVSRSWSRGRTPIGFFVEVQNVYDRQNASGFDIQVDEEQGRIDATREHWPGALLSAGFSIEF